MVHPSLSFSRFSRNEKIICVYVKKSVQNHFFSLLTANQTSLSGRGPIEEFLSSDFITSIKPTLCLGIPGKLHMYFSCHNHFFFLDFIFRLVKLARNSQPVLHGLKATTQEFKPFNPQERKQYNWLISRYLRR